MKQIAPLIGPSEPIQDFQKKLLFNPDVATNHGIQAFPYLPERYSPIDVFDISCLQTNQQIASSIFNLTGIDIYSPQGIDQFQKCFAQAVHTYQNRYMREVPGKYNPKIHKESIFQTPEDIFQFYREIQDSQNQAMSIKKASLLKLTYAASKVINNPTLQDDIRPILDDIFLSKVITLQFQMETRSVQRIQELIRQLADIYKTQEKNIKIALYDQEKYQSIPQILQEFQTHILSTQFAGDPLSHIFLHNLRQNFSLAKKSHHAITNILDELTNECNKEINPQHINATQNGQYYYI